MTAGFTKLGSLVPDCCEVLRFRRANGDGYVTSAGAQDLQEIRRWRREDPSGSVPPDA
jgi:hypothetical protein